MAVPTRSELDALIAERLAADPDFRAKLLDDPRAVVSEVVGVQLPSGINVTIHEETLTDLHIVVPAQPSGDDLSDDQLELVAGGGVCWVDICA